MDATPTSPTHVFLTDGASGSGLALARQFIAAGYTVSGVVDGLEQAHRLQAVGAIAAYSNIFRAGEVRSVLKSLSAKIVVHNAPQKLNHVPFVNPKWHDLTRELIEATPAVVQASAEAGVEFMIMLSSTVVYGDLHGAVVDETHQPDHLDDVMVIAALQAEQAILHGSVPACILRAGYVYGAEVDELLRLREAMLVRRPILTGDSHAYANWIHVDDLARAAVLAAQQRPAGQIFNVVDDHPASTVGFVNTFGESINVPPPGGLNWFGLRNVAKAQVDLLGASARASNQRAKDVLGWKPLYPTQREGIEQALLIWRAQEPVV